MGEVFESKDINEVQQPEIEKYKEIKPENESNPDKAKIY